MYVFYLHPPCGQTIRDDEQDARGLIDPSTGDSVTDHCALLEVRSYKDIGDSLRGAFWNWEIRSGVIGSAGRPGLTASSAKDWWMDKAPAGLPDFILGRPVPAEVKADFRAHLLLKHLVILAYEPAVLARWTVSEVSAYAFLFNDPSLRWKKVPTKLANMGRDVEIAIYLLARNHRVRGPMLPILHRFLDPSLLDDINSEDGIDPSSAAMQIFRHLERELFPSTVNAGLEGAR